MASPFSRFRKNQKKWLAFLGVVCMFTFVLWSPGVRFGCGSPHVVDETVQTRVRGVTMAELQNLVQQRERADRFAQLLDFNVAQARSYAQNKRGMTAEEINNFARQHGGFRPSLSDVVNNNQPFRDAFDTWLKLQKADELGVKVSDDTITEYVRNRSGETVSDQAVRSFLEQQGMNESQLYAALRVELLAQRVDELYGFGDARASELSPAERKELFDRQHRRAHTQVVPLKVENFAALVEEPSAETLKEFFERGRDRLPDPESAAPAFKLPSLAQFQYLRVSEPRLREAALAAITPAEVKAHYDKLVKDKKFLDFDLRFDERAWRESLTPSDKEGEKKDEKKDAAKKPGEADTPDKGATPKPKTDGKSGGSGAAATPREDAPPEARRQTYPVAAVAEALAQDDPPAKTTTPETKTDEPAKGKEPAKADDKSAPSDTTPPGDKTLPGPKSSLPKLEPLKLFDRTLQETLSDLTIPEDIRELPSNRNPEFKPLWQVEDKVREDLAKSIAEKDAQRLLALIKPTLEDYRKTAQKKKKDASAAAANPLGDPATARQIIDKAFAALAEEKKQAWKKSFEDRKKFVDAEIKRLSEEKELTPEGFKKLATESKHEEWLKLLADQQQLADVDKRAADTLETWQARLAKKRTNLDPEPPATPEKKEGAKAEKEATAPKNKTDSPPPKEDPKTAPEKKDAKTADAKTTEAKTTDVEKKAGDAKEKAKEDGKLEPTDAVISLDKTAAGPTGEGLDQRDFRRAKYLLVSTRLVEGDEPRDFMSWFEKASLFQPLLAKATDDQYLFWKIAHRPTTVLQWEQPRTKQIVLQEYRKHEARGLALEHARKLADDVRREIKDFPTEEVLRLFRTGKQDEKSRVDRASLSLSAAGEPEVYAVVAEIFEDGQRSPLPTTSVRRPLEAPPQDLEEARQAAVRLLTDLREPRALVIVGRSIGRDKNGVVFQGVEGFRWQASGQDAAEGDETKNVVSGPGRLAGRTFEIEIDGGDGPQTIQVVGEPLKPFTWDQLRPLDRRQNDEPEVVEGLSYPGEELAEAIFRVAPGELAVAMNQPQNIAYVVQVVGFDYSIQQPAGSRVYPSDLTLEKSPVRAEFLREVEQDERLANDPQFAAVRDQFNPVVGRFRREKELDQYRSWREGLYAEFDVKNDRILDRSDR